MPTYEYACKDCGEHLEVVQSFKDDALTECPNCHGELRKVFSAAGIIFKGSGWHIKDYGTSTKGGASTSKTTDAGDGSSGSGGSDKASVSDKASESSSSTTTSSEKSA